MKVLLIHQAFAGMGEPGGTRHYEFAKYLVRAGHEVSVICSQINYITGEKTGKTRRVVVLEKSDGIKLIRIGNPFSLHRSFVFRTLNFLFFSLSVIVLGLKMKRCDIVWGTTPPMFQAVSGLIISRAKGCRYLLEVRDLWPEFAIEIGVLRNRLLQRLARWLALFLYRHAERIVVNSPGYKTHLQELRIPDQKIELIPNGVSTDMFDPQATGDTVRNRFNLNGEFLVTYTGALGLANDIGTILRAAHELRQISRIRFLVVGDGKERPALERLSREMRLPNVLFVGSCAKKEIRHFLAASDVCVATLKDIPMFRTPYPNKVFDYMAAGRPIIVAIDGAARELVENAEAGIFVPPSDHKKLAEAIVTLYKGQTRARTMGKGGRQFVLRNFNRKEQAESFRNMLLNLAAVER